MAESTTPTKDPIRIFCSKSGYAPGDVLGHNVRLRTFTTTNGGKYQILKNGTIRVLKGPAYPKQAD